MTNLLFGLLGTSPDPSIIRTEATLAVIEESRLQRLADYWLALRKGRRLPSLTDVDPVKIPWALSRLFIIEHAAVDGVWRFRLAGTEIENDHGRSSLKGLAVADLFEPDMYEHVRARLKECMNGPSVVYMHGRIYRSAHRLPIGGRLYLPLADPGTGTVTGILGMSDWSGWNGDEEEDHLAVYAVPVEGLA